MFTLKYSDRKQQPDYYKEKKITHKKTTSIYWNAVYLYWCNKGLVSTSITKCQLSGVYKSDITTCYENLECAISAKEHWKLNTTCIGWGTFKSENKF